MEQSCVSSPMRLQYLEMRDMIRSRMISSQMLMTVFWIFEDVYLALSADVSKWSRRSLSNLAFQFTKYAKLPSSAFSFLSQFPLNGTPLYPSVRITSIIDNIPFLVRIFCSVNCFDSIAPIFEAG